MIRSSGPASWTVSPRASSTTWIATAGRRRRRWPPGRTRLAAALLAVLLASSCAYLNTFYNAERAFEDGLRLKAVASDSLTIEARQHFERAAEKSAAVLARHGDSDYADDAMFLLGRSLEELGRYPDAAAAFERLPARFPDSELASEARLGQVRNERRGGDLGAAGTALAPLLVDPEQAARPEIQHERALIALATGEHAAAVAAFRRLLEEHPEYARRENVTLAFADAELAAGLYDSALETYAEFRATTDDVLARREADLRFAAALVLAGRPDDALATYEALLEAGVPDSLAARVHAERGALFEGAADWAAAERAYGLAAQLAPGSAAASRATYRRGRIAWRVQDDRARALDLMLDAFLHAPTSVWGDSARSASRRLERILHYERIAEGRETVTTLPDPALARSTALYRLGEEILDAEENPGAAARVFVRLAEEYPDSPWRPKALLAAGLLARQAGDSTAGRTHLETVLAEYPDTPAADSARRALNLPVPERPGDFYGGPSLLATLAGALPRPADPMVAIADQMDRYASQRAEASRPAAARGAGSRGGPADAGEADAVREPVREPGREDPLLEEPNEPERELPEGAVP